MPVIREAAKDILWIGGNERRMARFENHYPVPEGMSYNSYLLLDEKTVLLDTADRAISREFFNNLECALGGRALDCAVVSHMEPDHAALWLELAERHSETRFFMSAMALKLMNQFFAADWASRTTLVKDGDTLCTGKHELQFFTAPMVHWPEVIVTYDKAGKTLFSADAFGSFGANDGKLFFDELEDAGAYVNEARRYYANIVGKYGAQVQALLHKASKLDIERICPLHGVLARGKAIAEFLRLYDAWSRYQPETRGVLIAYASIYGNTEFAVQWLAARLAEKGVNARVMDAASVHPSYIVAEAFRFSHIVLASPTYNSGVYPPMEALAADLAAHNIQNRAIGIIENGSWAPAAGKLLRGALSGLSNTAWLKNEVTISSAPGAEQFERLGALANELAAGVIE